MNRLEVDKVPTPHIENYQDSFNQYFKSFKNYLKEINFDDFKDSNWIDLTNEQLLKIEDFIITLSKPEYKSFLQNVNIPARPTKKGESNPEMFERALKKAEFNIKSIYYIKELIYIYSIYHNHVSRNYFMALCSNIVSTYSKSHPNETIDTVFRFKSPKGLIVKLAKNIFLNGHFESYHDENKKIFEDKFVFLPLNDVFAFKIIVNRGFSPIKSADPETTELIDKKEKLYKQLGDFDVFSEQLNEHPEDITNSDYLKACINLFEFIIKYTIDKKESRLITYYKKKITQLEDAQEELGILDLLDSPIDSNSTEDFKFIVNLDKLKKRIDAPLYLKGLRRGIDIILSRQTDETKLFQITPGLVETKHTSSGHEGIHYDINTPYGTIELQLQTESQANSDKYRPTSSHGLMPGKEIPRFALPRCYNYEYVSSHPKLNFEEAIDSDGNHYYFEKSELKRYIRLVELYTAKKGTISYNPETETPTAELDSSFDNYKGIALELPKNSNDPEVKSRRNNYIKYFDALKLKSQSILNLFFLHSHPRPTEFDYIKIKDSIAKCSFKTKELQPFDNLTK